MRLVNSDAALILALLIVTVAVIIARRVKQPYTIVLVLAGLAIGAFRIVPTFQITPHLIFLGLLPPLFFEGSFHLNYSLMRRHGLLIGLLAVPGVVISAFLTAALLHLLLGKAFGPLLVFGALIAATDPISVLAIFREVRAPKDLAVVIEGESLFNDGTAVVLFNIMVAAVVGTNPGVLNGIGQFLIVALGGVGLGLAIGGTAAWLFRQIDDHLVEITITTLVAFGGFYLAEKIGVSGPITVVVAGLLLGHLRSLTLSPTTRLTLESFWEYVGFLGNALVFLLIGAEVATRGLSDLRGVALAVLVALLVRALVVSLGNGVLAPLGRAIPWRWVPVMWWGGLRGAIALALVLSLPLDLPERNWIEFASFGIVIFTLLAQGLTIDWLLRGLGLRGGNKLEAEFERHAALLFAYRRALRAIDDTNELGDLSDPVAERLHQRYTAAVARQEEIMESMEEEHASLREHELRQAERRALLTERAALLDFHQHQQLSDETLDELLEQIDAAIVSLDEEDVAGSGAVREALQEEPSASRPAGPRRPAGH